ncbi:unnamed protein product [Medioppia subpectinata]|uniref:Peptidase S1 domain-containing protein n=1 Tax=Medioppia subpectinata TaxID=1979941 RepID=A0A7R9L3V8_9ACAR|nr:unnamed protein product [Medioppia subpectinata]CAG2114818.1 unnamed protein product [Medioppia subpectinata]
MLYFITPEYERNQWRPFDLGLIRLNTAIPLDGTSGVTGINAICLPEEWLVNEEKEYVILNGFGFADNNGMGSGVQRIGFARIEKAYIDPNNTLQRNAALYARRIPFPTGSATCKGDSGSPIVQYVNGVAVVIGIISGSDKNPGKFCVAFFKKFTSVESGPTLGAEIYWLTPELRQWLKQYRQVPDVNGVLIYDFLDDNNDHWANTGVRRYDVITAINGSDVRSLDDLYQAVDELKISGVMNVVVNSDGVVRRLVLQPTVGPQIAPSVCV